MLGEERRQIIMSLIRRGGVHTGTVLSEKLGVTRQVIVGDIALLRAAGEHIVATPQGYMHAPVMSGRAVRQTIAAKHTPDLASLREELYLIVEHGVTVLDVTVEHPLYGEITGNLRLMSQRDVDVFLEKMQDSNAEPLSVLTGGMHLHTLEAPDQETLQGLLQILRLRGFLAFD